MSAEQVENDATEIKFSKSVLHITLNAFIYLFSGTQATVRL